MARQTMNDEFTASSFATIRQLVEQIAQHVAYSGDRELSLLNLWSIPVKDGDA